MAVHLEIEYVGALAGLVIGAVIGSLIAIRSGRTSWWDARVTLPLVVAAGAAHLLLVPVVEPLRQVLFGLYFAGMTGTFVLALMRVGIWRLGAVLLPASSIAAYFYFAFAFHEVDFIGLAVKVVEVAVIAAALRSAFVPSGADARRRLAA